VYCSGKFVVDDEYPGERKEEDIFKKFLGNKGRKWEVYKERTNYREDGNFYVCICVEIVHSGIDYDGNKQLSFVDLALKQNQLNRDVESAQEGLWKEGMFGLFSIFEV